MEKYSHWPFEVTGYHVTIPSLDREEEIVMWAWARWMSEDLGRDIVDREYPSLHAVYYNYQHPHDPEKNQYDMIIGYITRDGVTQTDPSITTIQIPAQDYKYMTLTDISPENILKAWTGVNNTPASELARNYGYDLDMYNEDHTELTIAVSVHE